MKTTLSILILLFLSSSMSAQYTVAKRSKEQKQKVFIKETISQNYELTRLKRPARHSDGEATNMLGSLTYIGWLKVTKKFDYDKIARQVAKAGGSMFIISDKYGIDEVVRYDIDIDYDTRREGNKVHQTTTTSRSDSGKRKYVPFFRVYMYRYLYDLKEK